MIGTAITLQPLGLLLHRRGITTGDDMMFMARSHGPSARQPLEFIGPAGVAWPVVRGRRVADPGIDRACGCSGAMEGHIDWSGWVRDGRRGLLGG